MRHWPLLLPLAALAFACTPPAGTPPTSQASPRPTPEPSAWQASPSVPPVSFASPIPSPSPTATARPTPTPTPVPSASASSAQLRELSESRHGSKPFPSPPPGSALDLGTATVKAGAGNETAYGAIDGRIYTTWAARSGVADGVWLAVDMGASRAISRVDVLPDASPEGVCYFNIDVSDDGRTWRTVGSGSSLGSNEEPVWGSVTLSNVTTRHVRIKPTSWGPSWVALWEMRLVP